MRDGEIVLVQWVDAAAPDSLECLTEKDVHELAPLVMEDVGFYFDNGDAVTLVGNISEQGLMRRVITIPKVNVIKVVRLKRGREHE